MIKFEKIYQFYVVNVVAVFTLTTPFKPIQQGGM